MPQRTGRVAARGMCGARQESAPAAVQERARRRAAEAASEILAGIWAR
jgi:hypothetical protein